MSPDDQSLGKQLNKLLAETEDPDSRKLLNKLLAEAEDPVKELWDVIKEQNYYQECLLRTKKMYPPDGGGHGFKWREKIRKNRRRMDELLEKISAQEETSKTIYENQHFDSVCKLLIPDFEQVNLELMEYISRHPSKLDELKWREFELLLEAVFRNQGYQTQIGTGYRDGGIDLRLLKHDNIGEVVTLVQAKRYDNSIPIRLEAVQALAAVVDDNKANRGLFVTTSRYYPSAKKFAERQEHRIVLADSNDVAQWCTRALHQRQVT